MFEKSLGKLSVACQCRKKTKLWAIFPSIYLLYIFLNRDVNKAFARVTGSKINQGAVLKYPAFMNSMDQSPILTSSGSL